MDREGSVGKLFGLHEAIVINDEGKRLEPTEMGEICLKANVPFLGYLGDPVQTAKSHHDGYFKTGDVGYFDEDCFLYIVGRKSDMLFYNGVKVQALEIEEILNSNQGVDSSFVIGIPDEKTGNDLILALVKRKADAIDAFSEQEIQNYLNAKVADEKQLRGGVHFIDSIPKTPAGKINKAELYKLAKNMVHQPAM